MNSQESIISKLEQRLFELRSSEDIDKTLRQMLQLIYILKHIEDKKKKPPVGGGVLQMSLPLKSLYNIKRNKNGK